MAVFVGAGLLNLQIKTPAACYDVLQTFLTPCAGGNGADCLILRGDEISYPGACKLRINNTSELSRPGHRSNG